MRCAAKELELYFDPRLFAYLDVKQDNIEFSPFELINGYTIRGPTAVLKDLWSKEEFEPEVKSTYEYVVNLHNKLQESYELVKCNFK